MTAIYTNIRSVVSGAVGEISSLLSSGGVFDLGAAPVQLPDAPQVVFTQSPPSVPDFIEPAPAPGSLPDINVPDLEGVTYEITDQLSGLLDGLSITLPGVDIDYSLGDYSAPYSVPPLETPPGLAGMSSFVAIPAPPFTTDSRALTPPKFSIPTYHPSEAPSVVEFTPNYIPLQDFASLGLPAVGEVPSMDSPDELVVPVDEALVTAITNIFNGDLRPDAVRQFIRADVAKLRQDRYRQERAAFDDAAARGMQTASGALYGNLEELEYEANYRYRQAYEQGLQNISGEMLDTYTSAYQDGMEIEAQYYATFINYLKKLVDVYTFNVQQYATFYSSAVEVANAATRYLDQQVTAYNAYIEANVILQRAALSTLDSPQAVQAYNEAAIRVYEAQLEILPLISSTYGEQVKEYGLAEKQYADYLNASIKNMDILQNNLAKYEQYIKYIAAPLEDSRAKIEAYGKQIQLAGSSVDTVLRSFEVHESIAGKLSEVPRKAIEFDRAVIGAYSSQVDALKAAADTHSKYADEVARWSGAAAARASAGASIVKAVTGQLRGSVAPFAAYDKAAMDIQLALASVDMTNSTLRAQRDATQTTIDVGLNAATAETYAGLAAAAANVRSISTNIRSDASISEGAGYGESASESVDYTRSYSYSEQKLISV